MNTNMFVDSCLQPSCSGTMRRITEIKRRDVKFVVKRHSPDGGKMVHRGLSHHMKLILNTCMHDLIH